MKLDTVINLIRRDSIRKRLTAMVTMLTRTNYPTQVNIDGGSYTDGQRVVIGVPLQLTKEMIDRGLIATEEHVISILKGLTVHESEHIRSSSFALFHKFIKEVEDDYKKHNISGAGRVLGKGIMNAVEDGRIERRAINRLNGVGKHIRFMNLIFYRIVGKVEKDLLRDYLMSICTIATSNLFLEGWTDTYKGQDVHKLLEDCVPWIRKGVDAETPEDCYSACKEIHLLAMPVLLPLIKDQVDQQQAAQQFAQDGDIDQNPQMDNADRKDAPGKSKKQYSNDKKKQPQKPKDQEDGDEKQSGSKEKEDDQKTKGDSKGGQSDESESGKEDKGEQNDEAGSSSGKNDQEDNSSDNRVPEDFDGEGDESEPTELSPEEVFEIIKELEDAIKEENGKMLKDAAKDDVQAAKDAASKQAKREKNHLTPKEFGKISPTHEGKYKTLSSTDALDPKAKESANDLERVLLRIFRQMNQEERRFKRSGAVDKRSLTRLIANRDSDVFYQTSKSAMRPAAFCLDIDHSGSMSGSKMKLALRAASIVQEAIQKHFPLRVLGFNSGVNSTTLYDYKDYDDKANGSLLKFCNNATNGNCDGFAIEAATAELAKRSEEIKVLIVLSDGYPTVAYNSDPIMDAKNAVIKARKQGIIVIAIVFDVDNCDRKNFETIYEKNIIMCDPSEIEKNLGKEIEKIVRVM